VLAVSSPAGYVQDVRRPRTLALMALFLLLSASGGLWFARRGSQETSLAKPGLVPPSVTVALEPRSRKGGLDVTFLVASDTHLGFDTPDRDAAAILEAPLGIERTNLLMIDHMNEIEGKPFPQPIGGTVDAPRGVLISGDLTEDGGRVDWEMFEALYGRTGKEGPLRFPVFEGDGNHDRNRDWFVREEIARRHGGRFYSFDFDDLHLVCLAEAPDDDGLEFLRRDLDQIAAGVPVVVYFHYPLLGAYAENNWFGRGNYRDRFDVALRGHNVIGIFHGHRHSSGRYDWRGWDVYNVGSPKHGWRSFAVVHVTDHQMTVASWNYEQSAFWWWHQKPVNAVAGVTPIEVVAGMAPIVHGGMAPEISP
jgi:hypothetical protein